MEPQESAIMRFLNEIASTTKRTDKEAIIVNALNRFPNFYRILMLTYNPNITFRVHDVNVDEVGETMRFDDIIDFMFDEYAKGAKSYNSMVKHIKPRCSETSWDIVQRILKKDLDCGIGISTINKCLKQCVGNLPKIPDYKIPKASEVKHLDDMTFPAFFNEKYDGSRVTTYIYPDKTVAIKSSSGKELQQVDYLKAAILSDGALASFDDEIKREIETHGFILDGEFIAFEKDGSLMKRQKINGILNKMLNGNALPEEVSSILYVVFDFVIDVEAQSWSHQPLSERIENLEKFFEVVEQPNTFESSPYSIVESEIEAFRLAQEIINQGREGAVIKSLDSKWLPKRMKEWVKIKATYDVDVKVVGWNPHSKDPEQIGSLEISSEDGLITGNIGTGKWLTHERRRELRQMAEREELNDIILGIKVMEITEDKKGNKRFYIPRIEVLRHDKLEADSHDKIMDMIS